MFRIPAVADDPGFLDLEYAFQIPGFRIPFAKNIADSGFHKQNFPEFWNPEEHLVGVRPHLLGWLVVSASNIQCFISCYFIACH